MTDFGLGPALLFCPADRPERYGKAAERADAVILDLEDAVAPAYAAAQKAKALADKATPREQALIGALTARYADDPKAARAPLDKAYADEMAKVAAKFADDVSR